MRVEAKNALMAHLRADAGVTALVPPAHITGRLRIWTKMDVRADFPAIVVVATTSTLLGDWTSARAWELRFRVYVLAHGAADGGAQDARDAILDAVSASLARVPALGSQNLGAPLLIRDTAIDGTVETDEGATAEFGVAWIPVTVRLL